MQSHNSRRFEELYVWMRENKVRIPELALRAKSSRATICRLLSGERRAGIKPSLAAAVCEATGGDIGWEQFAAYEARRIQAQMSLAAE